MKDIWRRARYRKDIAIERNLVLRKNLNEKMYRQM